MPSKFTFGIASDGNNIEILYDATGQKLRKTVRTLGAVTLTQDYISGIELKNNRLEAIYNEEGRAYNTTNATQAYPYTWRREYNLKDHLGNTRVVFCDKNNNGVINDQTEILQETHYYPFGMSFNGAWYADATTSKNKYLYNGKELNEDFGLNLSDYGARWYDASIGRWWSVDPLAEGYPNENPYMYGGNNPSNNVDIGGYYKWPAGKEAEYNAKYPRLTRYLEYYMKCQVLNSRDITSGLRVIGGFSQQELENNLEWGNGFVLEINDLQSGCNEFNGVTGPSEEGQKISLDKDIIDNFESSTPEQSQAALLAVFRLILHETIHAGQNTHNMTGGWSNGNFSKKGGLFKYNNQPIGVLEALQNSVNGKYESENGRFFEGAIWYNGYHNKQSGTGVDSWQSQMLDTIKQKLEEGKSEDLPVEPRA